MRAVTSPCRPVPLGTTSSARAPSEGDSQPARPMTGPTYPEPFRHCDALEANCTVALPLS
jgi:hypothetical protein